MVRIRSGVILAAATLFVIALGALPFFLWMLLATLVAMREWLRLTIPDGQTPAGQTLPTLPFHAAVAAVLLAYLLADVATAACLAAGAALLGYGTARVLLLCRRSAQPSQLPLPTPAPRSRCDALWLAAGIPYLGLSAVSLLWLRGQADIGLALTLFLMATVWATDIGAFFVGRICGGPRLAPEISPQKTWSGLTGGSLCAGFAGGAVALVAGASNPSMAVIVGLVIALIGQAGDLFESILKRRHNMKDSGALIPGHGGLLDRVDGLIASAPVLALFHATLGTWLGWW